MQVAIDYGRTHATLDIEPGRLVTLRRTAEPKPLADPAGSLRKAMDSPRRYPPLRQALTPDDRVAVVVDDALPRAGELLGVVLDHVASAGVAAEAITVVSPPGSPQAWIDDLPDDFADVKTEVHDPADRKRVAYLAATKDGHRIYVNRTVVEADQLVIVAAPHYAGAVGVGPDRLIYPALSDADTRKEWDAGKVRHSADEVLWLLGAPFLVQVVPAAGDGVAEVIAGSLDTLDDGRASLGKYWNATAPAADVVIAAVGPTADSGDFARAAAAGAKVVRPEGHVVVLSDSAAELGEGFQRMLATDDSRGALKSLAKNKPADWPAASAWLQAVSDARVMLLSGLPAETVEGLFATALDDVRQVQRLVDAGGSCLVLPDAQRLLAVAE